MSAFHLAQVNIGRLLGPLDGPLMAGFVARLDEINALADASPGFVRRFQTAEGNATALRPYDDERILFNLALSVCCDASSIVVEMGNPTVYSYDGVHGHGIADIYKDCTSTP